MKSLIIGLLLLPTLLCAENIINRRGEPYSSIYEDLLRLHIATGTIQASDIIGLQAGGTNPIISASVYCTPTIKNYSNTAFSTSTLRLSLAANTTYQFTFYALMWTSATATGIKPTLNSVPKPNRIYWVGDAPLTATTGGHIYSNVSYGGTAFATGLTTFTNNIMLTGTIVTSASVTVLDFMFATELAGGYCQFQEGTASAIPTP